MPSKRIRQNEIQRLTKNKINSKNEEQNGKKIIEKTK